MLAVTLSEANKRQNAALSRFNAWVLDHKKHILLGAEIYAECVREGVDMTERLPARMRAIFENINRGRLLPEAADKLLGNEKMISVFSSVSLPQQERMMKEGVEVWRNNEPITVPVSDVRPSEAVRLLDRTGGQARLLSAVEQKERAEPRAPRHDKILTLRLTPRQYEDVARCAKRANRSPHHFIIDELVKAGALEKCRT